MSNQKPETKTPADPDDPFAVFFEGAERSPGHCLGLAKLEFTEEIVSRMRVLGMTKADLARGMEVQPGFVTRVLSGRNNFELGTMVKLARALDCNLRCRLHPSASEARGEEKKGSKRVGSGARAIKALKRSA